MERTNTPPLTVLVTLALLFIATASAQNCGRQAGNVVCPGGLCCSQFGWCGNTPDHCTTGCQSQCGGSGATPIPIPSGGGDVGSIITPAIFEDMLKHRNDGACEARGFYNYNAFISAARSFNGFGTTGDLNTRKKELAAFLAQTSHETTGIYIHTLHIHIYMRQRLTYCSSNEWPCPAGRQYYGRGPIQLTHNYNYGQAGRAIGQDLINNPDLVATNAEISFRTAMWFWMTHRAANRVSGYGVITNIINGGLECGRGNDNRVANRIGFYQRYCTILGVNPGGNLDCNNQRPFA
ncbi:unnamed protein product [Linum perenne]